MISTDIETTKELPVGLQFLKDLFELELENKSQHFKLLEQKTNLVYLDSIGFCMIILYRYSTCYYGCKQGKHILENYSGRSYNLIRSSLLLIESGFYDESLNLIRSLGEIGNTIHLFNLKPNIMKDWFKLDGNKHYSKFKPSSVRKQIELAESGSPIPMSKEKYSELSSLSTHLSPQTTSNVHSEDGIPRVGGLPQSNGLDNALSELVQLSFHVTRDFSRLFGHKENFDLILKKLENLISNLDKVGN